MPWINGQSGATRIANGTGLVVVNADGSVSVTPASGTGVLLGVAPPATSHYALMQIGNGPVDGVTAGHYTGSAAGGGYGANFASGYAGDLLRLQIAGSDRLQADANGNLLLGVSGNGADVGLSLNGTQIFRTTSSSGAILLLGSNFDTNGHWFRSDTATQTPLLALGVASQTGDLIQARDSGSHPQFGVANVGTGAAPVWALRVRAIANAESMAQLHTAGAATGRAIQFVDDAGVSLGWVNLTA